MKAIKLEFHKKRQIEVSFSVKFHRNARIYENFISHSVVSKVTCFIYVEFNKVIGTFEVLKFSSFSHGPENRVFYGSRFSYLAGTLCEGEKKKHLKAISNAAFFQPQPKNQIQMRYSYKEIFGCFHENIFHVNFHTQNEARERLLICEWNIYH